jgi:hypothetical protein
MGLSWDRPDSGPPSVLSGRSASNVTAPGRLEEVEIRQDMTTFDT